MGVRSVCDRVLRLIFLVTMCYNIVVWSWNVHFQAMWHHTQWGIDPLGPGTPRPSDDLRFPLASHSISVFILDDNLSFAHHSRHVCSRAGKRLSILKHLAGSPYGATQQPLIHYYKACIRPILEYGSITMSIACPSAIKRMESMQNKALRIALCLPQHARTKFVLTEAGCPALDDRP